MKIVVHPRVFQNPDVHQEDVEMAVVSALRSQSRLDTDPLEYVGVGPDCSG